MKSFILGISGGSGAGKTTLANLILKNNKNAKYIALDSYYKDLDKMPMMNGQKNFDSPFSYDLPLFYNHLKLLKNGRSIEIPQYDFISHSRKKEFRQIDSCGLIIIDGILIFYDSILRSMFDIKIFIDTPEDVRVERRITRDTIERGKYTHDVLQQLRLTVLPMHNKFIEKAKQYADYIVSGAEPFSLTNLYFKEFMGNLTSSIENENA